MRNRWHVIFLLFVSVLTYALFFVPINKMELWIDEIDTIRIAQLPLRDVASEVTSLHVAVPPLTYWMLWVWDKVVSQLPVSVVEFVWRIPFMALHTIAALLLVLTFRSVLKKGSPIADALVFVTAFFLYFFNPLLFAYSYEVRFYGLMLLGATVVINLYYQKKLFLPRTFPIVLLFCLASAFHFIILVPFIVRGFIDKQTRRNALYLGLALLALAALVVPHLYIPRLGFHEGAQRAWEGLVYLQRFYVGAWWKWFVVLASTLLLLFRKNRGAFFLGACLVCVASVFVFESVFAYPYFGGRHFLFLLPFLTISLYEVAALYSASWWRASWVVVMWIVFLVPFSSYIRGVHAGTWYVPKIPIGLKTVYQGALAGTHEILVEYGNTNKPDIEYYDIGISWYARTYPQVQTRLYTNFAGCRAFAASASAILYIVPDAGSCDPMPNTTTTRLYDAVMMTKGN